MNLVPATRERVADLEKQVDEWTRNESQPAESWVEAIWHVLTVSEDLLRMSTEALFSDPGHLNQHLGLRHRLVFQLKHALAALSSMYPQHMGNVPSRVSPAVYVACGELLEKCADYHAACSAFTSYASGYAEAKTLPSAAFLHFQSAPAADRYAALLLLESLSYSGPHAFNQVMEWAYCRPEDRDGVVRQIVENAMPAGEGSITYKYDDQLGRAFAQLLARDPPVAPAKWKTSYGSASEVQDLVHGLRCVAAYHSLSVLGGAVLHRVAGGGHSALVLTLLRSELVRRVQSITGIQASLAEQFINLLAYGYRMRTPDPALQPLIPVGNDQICFSPLLFLNGNTERNLLSLLARIAAKEFDSASSVFEDAMIARVLEFVSELRGERWLARERLLVPNAHEVGDVDLLLVDKAARTILVCELKWTIEPGDPREVANRKAEATKKANQARVKSAAVEANLPFVLALFGLQATGRWRVHPVVVFEGYSPPSPDDAPVVSIESFRRGMRQFRSLLQLWRWLVEREWLPIRGHQFTRRNYLFTINGVTLNWGAVELRPDAFERI